MTWRGRIPFAIVAIVLLAAALVVALAVNRSPGRQADAATTALARWGRFRDVVVLEGVVEAAPTTPLALSSPANEYRWAVENGSSVRRGDVLFIERAVAPGMPVQDLQQALAIAEEQVVTTRTSARRAVRLARRAVRRAGSPEERDRARADLRRALLGGAQEITSALQRRAQAADLATIGEPREIAHRATHDGVVRYAMAGGEAQGVIGMLEGIGHYVTSAIDPLLLYRFRGEPQRARVAIPGGPPRFRCDGVDVDFGEPAAGVGGATAAGDASAPGEAGAPGSPDAAAATIRCSVPNGVRVFPGLRAIVSLTADTLEHVVLIPAGAVRDVHGSRGTVTIANESGGRATRDVLLGPSDGDSVVVKRGLRPGTVVVVAPGGAAPAPAG
jgi:hypothetical protein